MTSARRPFYVFTSNYALSRGNAMFFAVVMVIAFVLGIVALLVRPSLALQCLAWFGLAALLFAQNAAAAAWLRRHQGAPPVHADPASGPPTSTTQP